MSEPVRLRETPGAAAPDARVIDAEFAVVAPKRRSWLERIVGAIVAIACAAAIGFLVPPAMTLLASLLAMVAE